MTSMQSAIDWKALALAVPSTSVGIVKILASVALTLRKIPVLLYHGMLEWLGFDGSEHPALQRRGLYVALNPVGFATLIMLRAVQDKFCGAAQYVEDSQYHDIS